MNAAGTVKNIVKATWSATLEWHGAMPTVRRRGWARHGGARDRPGEH